MEGNRKRNRSVNGRWILTRMVLVLFDILAVNLSYYLTLLIRFYVNNAFNIWATKYVPAFLKFAPYYTVCCLIVFVLFRLYSSRWRYAGVSDLNRIVIANLITCLIQIVGTLVFVIRMPITYYCIGAVFQFGLVAFSRFSYRLFLLEWQRVRDRFQGADIPVMIVGVGETSHLVRRHLEHHPGNGVHVVCLLDFRGEECGTLMEGIPVVSGTGRIAGAVKKYGVECVILADSTMPLKIRKDIREICGELHVDVQDFAGFFQDSRGAVVLRNLMEYTRGEVELVIDGTHMRFANGEQAVLSVTDKRVIKSIYARDSRMVVELQSDVLVPNDVAEEWVKTYERETGEDISFF